MRMDEELMAGLVIAFKQASPRTMSLSRDVVREGLEAVLAIIEREPARDHEFQEWSDSGNMCHVRNCQLANEEHSDY